MTAVVTVIVICGCDGDYDCDLWLGVVMAINILTVIVVVIIVVMATAIVTQLTLIHHVPVPTILYRVLLPTANPPHTLVNLLYTLLTHPTLCAVNLSHPLSIYPTHY